MKVFRWHLASAGGGVMALVAIVYLLTHGLADSPAASPFAHIPVPRGSGLFAFFGPTVQGNYAQVLEFSAAGSASAALMIGAAGGIAGCLCGSRSLSPAAPLAAGIPLLWLGLPWSWAYWSWGRLRPLGAIWGVSNTIVDHVPLVLGGVLIAAALVPGQRAGRPAAPRRKPWALGLLCGVIAIPVIGYLIQITNTFVTSYPYWLPAVLRTSAAAQRYVLPVLLIAALGSVVASRPLPRSAAVIAGVPMVAVGVLGLLAPATIASLFGWSAIPPSRVTSSPFPPNDLFGSPTGSVLQDGLMYFAISGLPLLYGAVLVAAGLSRDRWFKKRPAPTGTQPAGPAPLPDPDGLGQPVR